MFSHPLSHSLQFVTAWDAKLKVMVTFFMKLDEIRLTITSVWVWRGVCVCVCVCVQSLLAALYMCAKLAGSFVLFLCQ